MEKVLKLTLCLLLLTPCLYAQGKADLAALEKQAKAKEAQLKKIKQQEKKLADEIQRLTQREKSAEQLAKRLIGDIRYIETKQQIAKKHKSLLDDNMPLWQQLAAQEMAAYSIFEVQNSAYFNSKESEQKALMSSLLGAHIAFMLKLEQEALAANTKIQAFEEQNEQLAAQKDKAQQRKEEIADNQKKKQEDLDKTVAAYKKAQADLKELKESAAQMQKILKEAEEKRKRAEKKAAGATTKASINIGKNTLPWPVSGKIISSFGKEYNAKLKTWIFRDGLKISARVNEPVTASAQGEVIFAGEFRSYGNVVILDHDKGFFTIYGFLDEIRVNRGQSVTAGRIIGIAGKDTQGAAMGSGANAVYFEIRSGTTAVDPEIWLQKK